MKYLLIDFGASYIKSIVYDKDSKQILYPTSIASPFKISKILSKVELKNILIDLINKTIHVDGILICTIIGGGWIEDTYHSWQSENKELKKHCLISGLFSDSKNYHIHPHHDNNNLNLPISNLRILGFLKDIPVYSALGDTNCVIESLDIKEDEYIINIGTGSQVIYKTNNSIFIEKFIPAGRAFLVYDNFFNLLGLNFFELLNQITINDVLESNLKIDLNIFEQAINYKDGGIIANIKENNLTPTNLFGSLLKNFVLQYKPFIINEHKKSIKLVGGIPKKISLLKDIFKNYYPDKNIIIENKEIENTHIGMIKYINNKN
jgi:hypothetical protein